MRHCLKNTSTVIYPKPRAVKSLPSICLTNLRVNTLYTAKQGGSSHFSSAHSYMCPTAPLVWSRVVSVRMNHLYSFWVSHSAGVHRACSFRLQVSEEGEADMHRAWPQHLRIIIYAAFSEVRSLGQLQLKEKRVNLFLLSDCKNCRLRGSKQDSFCIYL